MRATRLAAGRGFVRFASSLFAFGLLPCCQSWCSGAGSAKEAIARCGDRNGDVRARPSEATAWNNLALGDALADGQWVQTAAESLARIDFFSGTRLMIGPGSLVVIEDRSKGADGELLAERVTIKTGGVRAELIATSGARELILKAASGEEVRLSQRDGLPKAAVQLKVSAGGRTEISGAEGDVRLRGSDGAESTLQAGKTFELKAGRQEPDLSNRPIVDQLLGPSDQASVRAGAKNPVLTFSWKPSRPGAKYRLVVAADPELSTQKVIEQEIQGEQITTQELGSGTYFWGVFEIDGEQPIPLFVRPYRLEVRTQGRTDLRVPKRLKWR